MLSEINYLSIYIYKYPLEKIKVSHKYHKPGFAVGKKALIIAQVSRI